jgi:shikimate kinase
MNKNMKCIVLIGMPGSGKTTIGKALSKKLGLKYVDIDKYIEKSTGKTIPEIFKEGEEIFRRLEKEAVNKFSKEKGMIISTGGGTIKNYSNIKALKENGIRIFIDRPIENIVANVNLGNRPLLKDGIDRLYDLYDERYELYKKYSDFQIVNDDSLEEAAIRIINIISNGYKKI